MMKKLMLKSVCQKDVDDIVARYDTVVGRDAKKWAIKLIKEHNLEIVQEEPEDGESIIDKENKKKKKSPRNTTENDSAPIPKSV